MTESTKDILTRYEVDTAGDCWLWTRGKDKDGYGKVKIAGRNLRAHRFIWEATNGQIPAGLILCHRCDVPACVNPSHIFLGTHARNHADRGAKGRTATGEAHGKAKLSADDVHHIRKHRAGHRVAAEKFGIGKTHYHRILRGEAWSNSDV